MVGMQNLKELEIAELDSLLQTKDLLRIAIFNISYIRGLFHEKYFNDKSVPVLGKSSLDILQHEMLPLDAESRKFIDWMEKGVYDALQKKYLRTLLFCVCEATEGLVIEEEYAFSFSYSDSDSQEVSVNLSHSGSEKGGRTFKFDSTNDSISNNMRSSACKMVRTLAQLMRTLEDLPEERTLLMKLLYYDITPADYEPPFFRGCTEEEEKNATWNRSALKMQVGNVNSKQILKVKRAFVLCEDENNENHDNTSSFEDNSYKRDGNSDSGTDTSMSNNDHYIVALAPAETQQEPESYTMVNEGDEEQLNQVKDWIDSYPLQTFNLNDILPHFPDISMVLIEEIMDKLVKGGVFSKSAADSYSISKEKKFYYEFNILKEEPDSHTNGEYNNSEDYVHIQALYHAPPMHSITTANLQDKLEADMTTFCKLIDKTAQDGVVESKCNRRLVLISAPGRPVTQSEKTEKKVSEVNKSQCVFDMDVDMDQNDLNNSGKKNKHSETEENGHSFPLRAVQRFVSSREETNNVTVWQLGNTDKDLSTSGALHLVGSDLTHTILQSAGHPNGSKRSDDSKRKTPLGRAQPADSRERERHASGAENQRDRGNNTLDGKASMVKEPIFQYMKRQEIQAVKGYNEYATTCLGFVFRRTDGKEAMIMACDSRRTRKDTQGNVIRKWDNIQKFVKLNGRTLVMRAGKVRYMKSIIKHLVDEQGKRGLLSSTNASSLAERKLSSEEDDDRRLSVLIGGWGDSGAPELYKINSRGIRMCGDCFVIGSGWEGARSVLDIEYSRSRKMTVTQAAELGRHAICEAARRHQGTGGIVTVLPPSHNYCPIILK
ncbi:OLC1v1013940C1 [Oldenlandia corymbosa var. corymbosa]|uniref:OLC1v1013940C1 n=1 Tax=Oldenlandia corymbosa var. corymbosa TaxID=529605 RepID=A0AAV1DZM3_OLDCO|nr:OLC1v1013940C1 [Oldenlandia corymbosa var. corymbosa]